MLYWIEHWSCPSTDTTKYIRIPRRATKIIPELRDLSYEECLKEYGLTTLETRRLRGDQIKVSKVLNGYKNINRIFSYIRKIVEIQDMRQHQ